MATIFSDDFARANGNLGGSNGWVQSSLASDNSTLTIASQTVVEASGTTSGVCYNTASIGSADYQVSIDVVGAGSVGNVGVVARHATTTRDYYIARWNGSTVQLYKCVSGTFTQLGSSVSKSLTGSNTLTLKCVGTTISVLWDGVQVISQTDSAHSSEGKSGVKILSSSVAGDNFLLEDFSVGGSDPVPVKSVSQSLGIQSAIASSAALQFRRFG